MKKRYITEWDSTYGRLKVRRGNIWKEQVEDDIKELKVEQWNKVEQIKKIISDLKPLKFVKPNER